jgi:hypothetical protein
MGPKCTYDQICMVKCGCLLSHGGLSAKPLLFHGVSRLMLIHDLDDFSGYLHDLGNLQVTIHQWSYNVGLPSYKLVYNPI